jgi:hypothetical protein
MPAPSTIVFFKDADGDEFPIRIWLSYSGSPIRRDKIIELATDELARMEQESTMRPTRPVEVSGVVGS